MLYRLAQHRWAGRIAFDTFSVIEVDPSPFPFDLCAPPLERAYIEALEPPLNTLKAATTLRKMVMGDSSGLGADRRPQCALT